MSSEGDTLPWKKKITVEKRTVNIQIHTTNILIVNAIIYIYIYIYVHLKTNDYTLSRIRAHRAANENRSKLKHASPPQAALAKPESETIVP